VSEQFLHCPNIVAVLEQMRCERVPEGVAGDARLARPATTVSAKAWFCVDALTVRSTARWLVKLTGKRSGIA